LWDHIAGTCRFYPDRNGIAIRARFQTQRGTNVETKVVLGLAQQMLGNCFHGPSFLPPPAGRGWRGLIAEVGDPRRVISSSTADWPNVVAAGIFHVAARLVVIASAVECCTNVM